MTEVYKSQIKLGEKYRDRTTGTVGSAISIHFYKNACERVVLTYLHDGDVKEFSFDAMDLEHIPTGKAITAEKTGGPARTMPGRRS